jgi:hypothetical protein
MTADSSESGIKLYDGRRLADLDFAEDIVLLSNTLPDMKKLTVVMENDAQKIGLYINADTKRTAEVGNGQCEHSNKAVCEEIEMVSDFYLGRIVTR